MKYYKLPVEIDAEQWDGDITKLPVGVELVLGIELGTSWLGDPDDAVAVIKTLEGKMIVSPDDWICRGVEGEIWPIKPDLFSRNYKRIE